MQITSNSIGFKGSVARQAYYMPNIKTGETGFVERSLEEMIASYDEAIAALTAKKEAAIKVDKFMREDEDIQKLIAQLPKDTYVSVNNFVVPDNYRSFRIEPITIDTLAWDEDGIKAEKQALDKNGEIDKKGIMHWLEKTIKYYNENR